MSGPKHDTTEETELLNGFNDFIVIKEVDDAVNPNIPNIKMKRLSDLAKEFLENDDISIFVKLTPEEKEIILNSGRPRYIYKSIARSARDELVNNYMGTELTEDNIEELRNVYKELLKKYIKKYSKIKRQIDYDVDSIESLARTIASTGYIDKDRFNKSKTVTKKEFDEMSISEKISSLDVGQPRMIYEDMIKYMVKLYNTYSYMYKGFSSRDKEKELREIREKYIINLIKSYGYSMSDYRVDVLNYQEDQIRELLQKRVDKKIVKNEIKYLVDKHGDNINSVSMYDMRLPKPVVIYVSVYSGANSSITISLDPAVEPGAVRDVKTRNIYDPKFREFMKSLDLVRDYEYQYDGKINKETFIMFSNYFLDGKYSDGTLYDANLIAIHIQTNFIEEMFETIHDDTFYRDVEPEVYKPYSEEEIKRTLEGMNLYRFTPIELPYDKFDNNLPDMFKSENCIIRMLNDKYGKRIGEHIIARYFTEYTGKELFKFFDDRKIDYCIYDVFGNTLLKHNYACKSKKSALSFIWFDKHAYPYIGRNMKNSRADFSVSEYNNVLTTNIKSVGDESMARFCSEFTSNFSYRSDEIFPKSIRWSKEFGHKCSIDLDALKKLDDIRVGDVVLSRYSLDGSRKEIVYKDGVQEVVEKQHTQKLILEEFGDSALLELDMCKAFHTVMFKLMKDKNIDIPVFSVKSIIKRYYGEKLNASYMYYLSEKSIKKTRDAYGLYSNCHHGFVVMHLLQKGIIKKEDITHFKSCSKFYSLNQYHEDVNKIVVECGLDADEDDDKKAKIVEEIARVYKDMETKPIVAMEELKVLIEEHCNCQNFRDKFMLYNGIAGMRYNTPKRISVKVPKDRYEVNKTTLSFKNPDLEINYVMDGAEEKVEFVKKHKRVYKYINNRNIYDYCISATNYWMMVAIDDFKKYNKNEIVRINTDCITFTMNANDVLRLTPIFDVFKFKSVNYETVIKTSVEDDYCNPEDVIKGIYDELMIMNSKTVCYTGSPGTGKTYTVKNNHKYDYAMTISNVCCRNMDTESVKADTIHSQFQLNETSLNTMRRLRKFRNKTIWFDEFSMYEEEYFNYIFLLTNVKNSNIIITGDHRQIPPIKGGRINLDDTFFQFLMFNGEDLTRNYRLVGNELPDAAYIQALEKLKRELDKGEYSDYDNVLKKGNFIATDIHLTFTRLMRNYVNNVIYDSRKHTFCCIDGKYHLSRGLRLLVNESYKKHELYKSVVYEVMKDEVVDECIELFNVTMHRKETISAKLLKHMTLGFAMTTHSSQGLTIKEDYTIHEVKKMLSCDPSIYYTALSRVSSGKWVYEGFDKVDKNSELCSIRYNDDFVKLFKPKDKVVEREVIVKEYSSKDIIKSIMSIVLNELKIACKYIDDYYGILIGDNIVCMPYIMWHRYKYMKLKGSKKDILRFVKSKGFDVDIDYIKSHKTHNIDKKDIEAHEMLHELECCSCSYVYIV